MDDLRDDMQDLERRLDLAEARERLAQIRLAAAEAAAMRVEMELAERNEMPSTEAWRAMEERLAKAEENARAGAELADRFYSAKRKAIKVAWGALGTALSAVGMAVWFSFGLARSMGARDERAHQREVQLLKRQEEDAAAHHEFRDAIQTLRSVVDRLTGLVDASRSP